MFRYLLLLMILALLCGCSKPVHCDYVYVDRDTNQIYVVRRVTSTSPEFAQSRFILLKVKESPSLK
jgi:hypothetical protein